VDLRLGMRLAQRERRGLSPVEPHLGFVAFINLVLGLVTRIPPYRQDCPWFPIIRDDVARHISGRRGTDAIKPFHEYPVTKHFFGCESGRTRTHAIYQINPTQTHWHDRLTLVPIPEKR